MRHAMGLGPDNTDFDPSIAVALMMAQVAKGMNVLPRAGGTLDQEAYTMEWLLLCTAALNKVEELKSK